MSADLHIFENFCQPIDRLSRSYPELWAAFAAQTHGPGATLNSVTNSIERWTNEVRSSRNDSIADFQATFKKVMLAFPQYGQLVFGAVQAGQSVSNVLASMGYTSDRLVAMQQQRNQIFS